MRGIFFILLSIFLHLSCKQKDKTKQLANWTEQEIKQYFIDSIAMGNASLDHGDTLNDFRKFIRTFYNEIKAVNIYDEYVYAFDEPYIDTSKIERQKKWFRVIVAPCFDYPYCLSFEKINNRSKLTLKMTNGDGAYYPGYLDFTTTKYIENTSLDYIANKLDSINFWSLSRYDDTTCPKVLDGQVWSFEAINEGKYNIVSRQSPYNCRSDKIKSLVQIVDSPQSVMKFYEYWEVKNKIKRN